eukprot:1326010-Amorphochlora_amoeboformis.AAC.1
MSDVKAPVAVAAYADGKDIPRESSTENKITRSFVRLGYHDYPKELVEVVSYFFPRILSMTLSFGT